MAPTIATIPRIKSLEQDKAVGLPKSEFYMPELDGLRTCAFLSVFMYHASVIKDAPHFFVFDIYNKVIHWGFAGVDFFFVLSGYLITTLLLREKMANGRFSFRLYFMRRMLRIWPLYYLMLVVGGFVLPLLFHDSHLFHARVYKEFLFQILMPMSFWMGNYAMELFVVTAHQFSEMVLFPLKAWFFPLWSISAEEQFYLTWPLVLMVARTPRQLVYSALGLILLSIGVTGFFSSSKNIIALTVTGQMSGFCLLQPLMVGALVAISSLYFPRFWAQICKFAAPISLIAFIMLATIVMQDSADLRSRANPISYTPLVISLGLILASTTAGAPLKRLMSSKWLAAPGKITYGLYIVHFPIMTLVNHYFAKQLPGISGLVLYTVTTGVTLLLTVATALILWFSFEKKILALRKKFVSKTAI